MNHEISLSAVFEKSEDIVDRLIEDELIIIPLTNGIGDMEDEMYTLNESGKVIWKKLDGVHSVNQIIDEILQEYDVVRSELEADTIGILSELLHRKIIIQVK